MPLVEFETTISAGEWPKTYALDHAATGTGNYDNIQNAKASVSASRNIRFRRNTV
jgi:hypothetical protein